MERSEVRCPKCGSAKKQHKKGFTSTGNQWVFCNACKYTPKPKSRAYSDEVRKHASLLCSSIQQLGAGSNENGNRILRRFVPKGTDIVKLTARDLQRIEDWVNNYPRKLFGYLSANEVAASGN